MTPAEIAMRHMETPPSLRARAAAPYLGERARHAAVLVAWNGAPPELIAEGSWRVPRAPTVWDAAMGADDHLVWTDEMMIRMGEYYAEDSEYGSLDAFIEARKSGRVLESSGVGATCHCLDGQCGQSCPRWVEQQVLMALGAGDRASGIARTLGAQWDTGKVRLILIRMEQAGRVRRHDRYATANDVYWIPA